MNNGISLVPKVRTPIASVCDMIKSQKSIRGWKTKGGQIIRNGLKNDT